MLHTSRSVSRFPGATWGTKGEMSFSQNSKAVSRPQGCFNNAALVINGGKIPWDKETRSSVRKTLFIEFAIFTWRNDLFLLYNYTLGSSEFLSL